MLIEIMKRLAVPFFGLLAIVGLQSSALAAGFSGSMSGSWWNPDRSGEGQFISFEQFGSRQVLILAYFTYDKDGRPRWLIGNTEVGVNSRQLTIPMLSARGPRFGVGFDSAELQTMPAGTVQLTYIDCERMAFRYEGQDQILDVELQRLVGPLQGTDCHGVLTSMPSHRINGAMSGVWWDPDRSGEGQFLAVEQGYDRILASVYYFTFDDEGAPLWKVGGVEVPSNTQQLLIPLVSGSGAKFGKDFSSQDVQIEPAGTVRLMADGCDGLRLRYEGKKNFGLNLERMSQGLSELPCSIPESVLTETDSLLLDLIEELGLTGDPSAGRELPGPDAPLAELGELLFFSKGLSTGLDVACASCHHPALGGADGLAISIGVNALDPDMLGPGRRTADGEIRVHRNASTFFNTVLWDRGVLWDSRVESLDGAFGLNGSGGGIRTPDTPMGVADPDAGPNLLAAQARLPVVEANEMHGQPLPGLSDNDIRNYLAARLGDYGEGQGLLPAGEWLETFQRAFDSEAGPEELITFDNIALAVGEYQRSAVFVETPWSRYVRGDFSAIDDQAKEGALLFFRTVEEGGMHCVRCHSGDLFSNQSHHRVGFPQVGPGFGDGEGDDDFGRGRETGHDQDKHAFRTPSLLNVELTAPYGHAGAYTSLNQVGAHYFNPGGTSFGQIFNRRWCEIPPFDTQPDCEEKADAVLANSRAALDSLQAARAESPGTEMPRMPVELSTQKNFDAVVAFLKTLTDPCLKDRACYGRWIPEPDQAPDGLQLNAIDRDGNRL